MIITEKLLARRTVLRGVDATLALPLFDAMSLSAAAKTAAKPAQRLGAMSTEPQPRLFWD
jgi:hypothetical protein